LNSRTYFSENDLANLYDESKGTFSTQAYTLRSPMPQVFLVTQAASNEGGMVSVRTSTFTPISWGPYTMAVCIPNQDEIVVRNLTASKAECVLALPARNQLRQLTLCSQRLPANISEVNIARFKLNASQTINVPGIEDCPVNFECRVEHVESYYEHVVAFLTVVGASIDASLLFKEREEIVSMFPTNLADEVVTKSGTIQRRVSLINDLFLCPTFPVSPKQGWYATFDVWMQDLMEEEYLNQVECEKLVFWYQRWEAVFEDLKSSERAQLREKLTQSIRLIVRERWDNLHTFLIEA
jgi:flavin reductase (DIM6/NTAB) family NADH-FMN oxidoreductase RutF